MKKWNPNNPVIKAADGQWCTIAALLVWKLKQLGHDMVEIRNADIDAFNAQEKRNLGIGDAKGYIELFLMDDAEAAKQARNHPGITGLS
jgi:hypothetical protein